MSNSLIKTKNIKEETNYLPVDADNVTIEPQNCLQFRCTAYQITAALRISLTQSESESPQTYQYVIKASNNKDYIVIEPKGKISSGERRTIYFYFKKNASISQNLKDKFLLEINKANKQVIYRRKLSIIIESALRSKGHLSPNALNNLNYDPNKMTKIMSFCTGPNNPQSSIIKPYILDSEIKNIFGSNIPETGASQGIKTQSKYLDPKVFQSRHRQKEDSPLNQKQKSIRSHASEKLSSNKPYSEVNIDESNIEKIQNQYENLKANINSSIQDIEKMKRKIIVIQNQNKSREARARFRLYLTVILVVIAFFMGVWVKKLRITTRVEVAVELMKQKFDQITENKQIQITS